MRSTFSQSTYTHIYTLNDELSEAKKNDEDCRLDGHEVENKR
jgi:hypothetical protein